MSASRLIAAAVLAASTCAGAALAAAQSDGGTLREQLPGPGSSAPAGTRHFAGFERSGTYAIAVVVHRNGSALAFICDGKQTWRWLSGRVRRGRLALRGPRGARLTASVRGSRVAGTLRLAGKARRFSLRRSPRRLGLRRLEDGRFEAAWIVTAGGRIRGVGTRDQTAVISASADSTTPTTDEGTTAAGDGQVSARLFTKARCTIIHVKVDIIRFRQNAGTATEQDELDLLVLLAKFNALRCPDALGLETQP
jgi:hypothetical protein